MNKIKLVILKFFKYFKIQNPKIVNDKPFWKEFFKFAKIEFRFIFAPVRLAVILGGIFFPCLLTYLTTIMPSNSLSFNVYQTVLMSTSLYIPIFRVNFSMLEKFKSDRAKVEYLIYDRRVVAFSKMMSELTTVLISYAIVLFVTLGLAYTKNNDFTTANIIRLSTIFIFLNTIAYIPIYIGIKWIFSLSINNQLAQFLAMMWVLLLNIPGLLFGSLTTYLPSFMSFFEDAKWVFIIVPWFNQAVPSLLITNKIDAWTMVFLIIEIVIILRLIWNRYSLQTKNYAMVA